MFLKPYFQFIKNALIRFRANQGILLSGAIAYYTLLSIIPLFTLILTGLSHFFAEEQLLAIVQNNLSLLIGDQSQVLTQQIATFIDHRETVSWLVLLVLVFFSSMAFTVLENAMSVIFFHRVVIHRRHFLISAIIPYIYIALLGFSILIITLISGAMNMLDQNQITVFIWTWQMNNVTGVFLYGLGMIGLTLLLTSFYMVMPVGKISFSHAFIGSIAVVILWEATRHILVWYFSTLSMVNLIYGSLATTIVALLFLEMAAIILLFGAQLIAEYERRDDSDYNSNEDVGTDKDGFNT
ncbi:YihY/virulence factor BrkB family protein [uncultured Cocleimonas sp.]|uniref:YihY/virulence factor BrkB family protein n=1 Tax=uncultured Cocleimonas sp. TaxID=1051587 RepID=UPI00260F36BF|nr:YihY/virulence factor BrkB family protein [uncultured Cocleimonas sp.]